MLTIAGITAGPNWLIFFLWVLIGTLMLTKVKKNPFLYNKNSIFSSSKILHGQRRALQLITYKL